MSGRFTKRGKNPGAIDSWLDSLGYYRKNIAYDETCLFRAVSEQLYYTQINHEDIRNKVIDYASNHYMQLRHLIPSKREWDERIHSLSVHMVICSEIEIRLISRAFQIDVKVFDAAKRQMQEYKFDKSTISEQIVQICKLGEDHYDAVYDKEHIVDTAIVYGILYERVFELPNVSSTVNSMLHDKDGTLCMYYAEEHGNNEEIAPSSTTFVLAPFPFKVAKALDPNMYRNIEYDSWLETRREFRLGEWYYGDDNLILGTRCLVTIGNEEHQCYIQEFVNNRTCVVFVTKLAQRITVGYNDLRRESDAKPWPLPYRFARGSVTVSPPASDTVDNVSKSFRKRRDKKRADVNSNTVHSEDIEANTFEGCPLVKQESNDMWLVQRPKLSLQIASETMASCNNEDWNIASEPQPCRASPSNPEFYIDLPSAIPTTSDTAPATVYQGDPNDGQVVYSYNQEYSYPTLPVWSNPPYAISPDAGVHLSDGNVSASAENYTAPQQKYVYCAPDSAYSSPVIMTPVPPVNYNYCDRLVCTTPLMQTGPPRFDLYPFVYSPVSIPTTPIYYQQPAAPHPPPPSSFTGVISPVPTITPPRTQDYGIPATLNSPMAMYSSPYSPYELQYYSTPPVYPSTWSYPHLNPQQGFIYPTPVAPNIPNYI